MEKGEKYEWLWKLICGLVLRTAEFRHRREATYSKCSPRSYLALSNGLVSTTTGRRKALNKFVSLSNRWQVKGRDTREPTVDKLSHRNIKHGPKRLSWLPSLLPAYLILLPLLMGKKHELKMLHGVSESVIAAHSTSFYSNFPTLSLLDPGYPEKPWIPC